ncbi:hypothetical protein CYYG_00041 [Cyanophage SS120-1]|uniref:Uncharacterized protein n=1 Tax=Cyanophage SS120-1 TaxID=616674 RepID=M1UGU4_9CAUD|nr:hypothetical protein CYYG_00041 [Cyanophage SS120-1]AGG54542.1 hypothetical protein CYYG_00041 [Cyanophage SS120-1]
MCSTPDIPEMPAMPDPLPAAPPAPPAPQAPAPLKPPEAVSAKDKAKLKKTSKKGQLAQQQGGGSELIIPLQSSASTPNIGTPTGKKTGKKSSSLNVPK